MLSRTSNLCTALVLSAAVLAGGLTAPAVHHAHIGGDKPHDHGDGHGHGSAHGHEHRHHHHGHAHGHSHAADTAGRDVEHDGAPLAATYHAHVFLLWFQISIPLDESGAPRGGELGEFGQTLIIARLVGPEGLVTPVGSNELPVDASQSPPTASPDQYLHRPTRRALRIPSALLLCDSARGERSGVQLI